MRITKKFNGDASIGKQTFVRARYDGSQPLAQWKAEWTRASDLALIQFFANRATFFAYVLTLNNIDLSMIVPERAWPCALAPRAAPPRRAAA